MMKVRRREMMKLGCVFIIFHHIHSFLLLPALHTRIHVIDTLTVREEDRTVLHCWDLKLTDTANSSHTVAQTVLYPTHAKLNLIMTYWKTFVIKHKHLMQHQHHLLCKGRSLFRLSSQFIYAAFIHRTCRSGQS